jgi:dTDP-4-dehydrorhamnose reductase
LDDWQIRVPTYTPDIARVLLKMADAVVHDCRSSSASGTSQSPLKLVPWAPAGVYNYSAAKRFTRWTLCRTMAEELEALGSSSTGVAQAEEAIARRLSHIRRDPNPPSGAPRPLDCMLDTAKIQAAGFFVEPTPFREALRELCVDYTWQLRRQEQQEGRADPKDKAD